ncbi:MAG: hypothetical protein ACE5IM_08325, partial [Nitrospinota bacterium]
LNETGKSFRMSGYRRAEGRKLTPLKKDIESPDKRFSIPSTPPLGIVGHVGFDYQEVRRRGKDGGLSVRTGSSFDFNELEVLAGAPLGKNLSFFLDYELFETEIENRSGPGEANETDSRKDITFETEGPSVAGMAMLIWNSVLPPSVAPQDSLNIVIGINELPLGFSPEHMRLSASPFLIYERRAVDLLSGTPVEDLFTESERDRLFRLSKEQIGVEVNGVLGLGAGPPSKRPAVEYHVGVINGSNNRSDANTEKGFFGRLALTWMGQTAGLSGFWSPDIYNDTLRPNHSIANGGIFSGQGLSNEAYSVGPDLTLSLQPFNLPVWLETQVLFSRETNPTVFNKRYHWWGGFTQLNAKVVNPLTAIAYFRYDWIRGDRFDDTPVGGVTGPVEPRDWAATFGLQWYVLQNMKIMAEFSRHEFRNIASTPKEAKLVEDFLTLRVSLGF